MAIKVTNYIPTNDPTQSVVALINFFIEEWGLHLYGCKYVRKKNGGFFVAFPTKKVEKEGEKPQYIPYYNFERKVMDRFQSSAQRAIHEYINTRFASPAAQDGYHE